MEEEACYEQISNSNDATFRGNNCKQQQCNKFSRFRSHHAVAPLSLPLPLLLLLMMMMPLLILPHNSHQFPSVSHNLSDENENNEVLDVEVQPRFQPYDALESDSPALNENLEEAIRNSVKSEIEMERQSGSVGAILDAFKDIPEAEVRQKLSDEILSPKYQEKPTQIAELPSASASDDGNNKDSVEDEVEDETTTVVPDVNRPTVLIAEIDNDAEDEIETNSEEDTETEAKPELEAETEADPQVKVETELKAIKDTEEGSELATENATEKKEELETALVNPSTNKVLFQNENLNQDMLKNETIVFENKDSNMNLNSKHNEEIQNLAEEDALTASADQTFQKQTEVQSIYDNISPIHASASAPSHISKIEPGHVLQSIEEKLSKSNLFSTEQTFDGLSETKVQESYKEPLHTPFSAPSIEQTVVKTALNMDDNLKLVALKGEESLEKKGEDLVPAVKTENAEAHTTTEIIQTTPTATPTNESLSIVLEESVASTEQTALEPPIDDDLALLVVEKEKQVLEYQTTTVVPVQDVHIIIKKQGVKLDFDPEDVIATTVVATVEEESAISAHKETLVLPVETEEIENDEPPATTLVEKHTKESDGDTSTTVTTTTSESENEASTTPPMDHSWQALPEATSTDGTNNLSVKGSRSINTAQRDPLEKMTATLFESYSPRDAGQTFNDHIAAESNDGVGKALPTRRLYGVTNNSTTTIIMLCTSTVLLLILALAAVFFISFHRQHGTLDIEMQEQRCGKDDLNEEDAETCSKLLEVDLTKTVETATEAAETDECL